MRLTNIRAQDFLSFDALDLDVGPALTFVTGPNGVGKTNLGRCVDVIYSALAHFGGNADHERFDRYREAGRFEAESFRVGLELELDQQWERELVLAFVRAAYACGERPATTGGGTNTPADLDVRIRALLASESLSPLWSGTLHLHYVAAMRNPWFLAWEFRQGEQTWHIGLGAASSGELRAGSADANAPWVGNVLTLTQRFAAQGWEAKTESEAPPGDDAELEATPGDIAEPEAIPIDGEGPAAVPNGSAEGEKAPSAGTASEVVDEEVSSVSTESEMLDFRAALPDAGEALSMRISPPNDMSNPLPLSLRELATGLGVVDIDRRSFEFVHVLWEILRRGVVLTDNRRVPFKRQFTHADFDRPFDLRDGGNIPAELYRLKNGRADEQQRYANVETMFARLTSRRLGLRGRMEPPHASGDGLITIEPTVVTDKSEHLIEFCGAGVQEALVLSALASGDRGRLILLDEPAVNLEPIMQRRLTKALRDVGQCLVITHSPDLVPIDKPGDLENIVRLASTPEGPRVRRASTLNRDAWSRWVKLLEPSHVRALLFASKVVLCEGFTEVGALQRWWRDTTSLGLPDPETAHVPIVGVDGDSQFGAYVDYLDAFGVPWAIVADGPALRPTSNLAKQLRGSGHLDVDGIEPAADFEHLLPHWRSAGVFTFATQFGDDGNRGGEFEVLLNRVDAALLARVQAEIGARKKPQVGVLFATEHPTAPAEVLALYSLIMGHFGYHREGVPTSPETD